jgi:hypothetical protein
MRTLLAALVVTMLIGGSAVIWKAEAGMISGVGSLPLTNSYSPVQKVRQRYRRGYEYDHHYGLRFYRRDYGYPRPGLHVRDTRVSETVALSALAAWYAVLSLSQLTSKR